MNFHSPYLKFRASYERRRKDTERQKAQLAERVAEGWSIAAAARELGVSQQRGSRIFAMIRADLGEQAR